MWYRRASDRGCVTAMLNMSRMYEAGTGVEKDLTKSVHYLMKAANKGDYLSTVRLGDTYMSGKLGFIDCVAAQAWYKRATKCPNIEDTAAFMALAKLHNNKGPKRDKYLKKAAEHKLLHVNRVI
jgi:TPR repeat protein